MLTCRESRLTWYNVNDLGKIELKCYDTETGELTTAAEDVISSNPYERTVGDAYAKDENGLAVVHYPGGEITTNCASENFALMAADNSGVIWSETLDSGISRLYLYDCNSGNTYITPAGNHMGTGIINDCFFINRIDGLMFAYIGSETVYRDTQSGFAWAYCFPESGIVGLCSDNKVFLYHIS